MTTATPSELTGAHPKAVPPSGLLVVDKTRGPTSHDVVAVARRVLGTKAIGHTGTLDPMATGALLLVVGEATKLVSMLGARDKLYRTTIRLGVATHSLDAEGEVLEERPVPPLTHELVEAAMARFLGEIAQVPPQVSAIKLDGQSAHARARRGEHVELPARSVRLDGYTLHALRSEEVELSLRCGKGFYVRALARDLAEALGTVGHLTALRREENAGFSATGAVSFDELVHAAKHDPSARRGIAAQLIPLADICARLSRVTLDDEGIRHVRCGRRCPVAHVTQRDAADRDDAIAFDAAGVPRAIVRIDADVIHVARGINA